MTPLRGTENTSGSFQTVAIFGALLAVGALAFTFLPGGYDRLLGRPEVPWPAFAVAFFLLERKTVDFHFRGQAHSFSMADIPLVIGIFYLPPALLLLSQLLGTAPAFGIARRLPPIKTIFNSILYLMIAIVVMTIVRAFPEVVKLDLKAWIVVLLALSASSVISSLLISLMIYRASGLWPRDWTKGLSISSLVSVTNGSVGLLAVLALRYQPSALLLFVPPALVLRLAYSAYASQQQRQAALAKLNQASQETASRLVADEIGPLALVHACDLFAAGYAELVMIEGSSVQRWVREGDVVSREDDLSLDEAQRVLAELGGGGFSFPGAEEGAPLCSYLAEREVQEAMVVKLSERRQVGFIVVGNRVAGTTDRFRLEDIHLLENLAEHLGALMANARLVKELQSSLEAAGVTNEELRRTMADRDAAEARRASLEERLRHSQKMEAVGRLARGIAHDFNNLLTIITGYAAILRHSPNGDAPLGAAEIASAAERGSRLVRQLLLFAREGESPDPQVLDLNQVVLDLRSLLSMSGGATVMIKFELDPKNPEICIDRSRLDQILLNLVANARDALPEGGQVTISSEISESGQEVSLRVSDTGKGMSPEILDRVFEPFFTTKEADRGTGLGLATVYGIVQEAGGEIDVTSVIDCGTTFELRFPIAAESSTHQ